MVVAGAAGASEDDAIIDDELGTAPSDEELAIIDISDDDDDDEAIEDDAIGSSDELEDAIAAGSDELDGIADISDDDAIAISDEDDEASATIIADDDAAAALDEDAIASIIADDEDAAAADAAASDDDAAAADEEDAAAAEAAASDEDEAAAAAAEDEDAAAAEAAASADEDEAAAAAAEAAASADDDAAAAAAEEDEAAAAEAAASAEEDAAAAAADEDDAAAADAAASADDEAAAAAASDDAAAADDAEAAAAADEDAAAAEEALSAAADDAAAASELALAAAADEAAASSTAAEDALEALDGAAGGVLPPQALSIKVAARTIGSPAISLICMVGIPSSVATLFAEPSTRPLVVVIHQELSFRRDCLVASHGILHGPPALETASLVGERDHDIHGRRDDDRVEEKRKYAVHDNQPAHGVGGDRCVRCLGRHANHIGEVKERHAVRFLAAGKIETGPDLARFGFALLLVGRLVVLEGVVHRPHGVDSEPAEHHGDAAQPQLQALAGLAVAQHEEQRYRGGDDRGQHDQQNEERRGVVFGGVAAQEFRAELVGSAPGQDEIDEEERVDAAEHGPGAVDDQRHEADDHAERHRDVEIAVPR